jgi:metal-responsive CopG/Arc/MetJ family transcriptional regulator
MSKRERRSEKRKQVTITLAAYLLDDIDDLAKETDLTRSDVIEALLDHCFENDDIIDEVFPYEEDKEDGED